MDNRRKIQHIRARFLQGDITYEEAKVQVEKLLVDMNLKGEKIAKKHGMKFTKLTFNYVFR